MSRTHSLTRFCIMVLGLMFAFYLAPGCGGDGTGGTDTGGGVTDSGGGTGTDSSVKKDEGGKDEGGKDEGGKDEGGKDDTTPDDGGTTPDDGGTTPDDGGTTPDDGGSPDDGGAVDTAPPAPTVTSTTPADGTKQPQSAGKPVEITVVFDQDMDTSTFTQNAVSITPATSGKVSKGANDKTLTFTPDQDLRLFTKYTVTITTDVKSKGGVAMAKDFTFSFETVSDKTDPNYLGTFSSAGGVMKDSSYTHYTVFGQASVAAGKMGGSGSATVWNGFIYTYTY